LVLLASGAWADSGWINADATNTADGANRGARMSSPLRKVNSEQASDDWDAGWALLFSPAYALGRQGKRGAR
jgi:hypothetical protein